MDKFTRYALLTLVLIVAIMTVSAYIGYMVGGNAATDDLVNDMAGQGVSYFPFTVEIFGEIGEYIGFFVASCAAGGIIGYLLPSVLNSNTGRKK